MYCKSKNGSHGTPNNNEGKQLLQRGRKEIIMKEYDICTIGTIVVGAIGIALLIGWGVPVFIRVTKDLWLWALL